MQRLPSRNTFLAGAAAFAATAASAGAQTPGLTPIHMAGSVNDDVTPMLVAIANGSMRRAGIDITLDKATSGSAVSAGVVGGSYQIGKSSVAGLITAHAKGVPFVFVAPGGLYEASAPVTALMVRSDSPARTGADLNGKTVAVSAIGDLYTLALKGWVDQHGGDSTTLKLIEIPLSSVPAALETSRIDAGCLEEPEVSEALASGQTRVLGRMFDSISSRFMYTGWFATLDFATQNRALLDRFRAAFRDAANYSNAHHAETVDVSSKFTLIDPKIVAAGTRVTAAVTLDPKLIQPVIEASAKYKTIPASFDARDMIDPALR
jgi:NitT/TauT family transport system substrate-binding protein